MEAELRHRSFFRYQEKGGHDGGRSKESRNNSKEQNIDNEEDDEDKDEECQDNVNERTFNK